MYRNQARNIFYNLGKNSKGKPTSSEVLTSYIKQCNEPPWTSYFVKVSKNPLKYDNMLQKYFTKIFMFRQCF